MASRKDQIVALFKLTRMTCAEIAEEIGKSTSTVEAVLGRKEGQHFSVDTRDRVYAIVERHAAKQRASLNRLSGGALG